MEKEDYKLINCQINFGLFFFAFFRVKNGISNFSRRQTKNKQTKNLMKLKLEK